MLKMSAFWYTMVLLAILSQAAVCNGLKIGAFNIKTFGKTKMAQTNIASIISKIADRYDVLLLQEVRDKSLDSVRQLTNMLTHPFSFVSSEPLGRTTYKEQYVYLYRTDRMLLLKTYQYPDVNDVFARARLLQLPAHLRFPATAEQFLSNSDLSKMVSARVTIVFSLLALLSLSSAVDLPETPVSSDAYRELATEIRVLAKQAKTGNVLSQLSQIIFELQTDISELIGQLPAGVSQCETQGVVKLAAAQIGSHEVLGLLTARTPLAIMSYRLSLCFSFLEEVVQLYEEQLELSRDVSHFLFAFEFGTNVTLGVIDDADEVVNATLALQKQDGDRSEKGDRSIGEGFSVDDAEKIKWKFSPGKYTFNPRPTRNTRQTEWNFGVGWNPNSGWNVNAGLTIRF